MLKKGEGYGGMPQTWFLSNGHQGMASLVLKKSPNTEKFIRIGPSFLLYDLSKYFAN